MNGARAVLRGVASYLPPQVVTNHDLAKRMDTSDEWIVERTGIRERRHVEPGTTTSTLASHAVRALFKKTGLTPGDFDLLIAATLSPDYYFPGIGPLIQRALDLPPIPALDIRVQCSGFVYGLATADAYIRAGMATRVLLVCAEVQSPCLNFSDAGRDMAVLFGDGAAAVAVEASDGRDGRGVLDSLLGADGKGAEQLYLRSPGTATPGFVTAASIAACDTFPRMEGRAVFKEAVGRMGECVEAVLARNGIAPTEISLLVPHQANLRISEALRTRLGLPPERVFNNIHHYGNTTAATIPLCLVEAEGSGILKRGDLVVSVAFGSGFTWGCNLLRW